MFADWTEKRIGSDVSAKGYICYSLNSEEDLLQISFLQRVFLSETR